MINELIFWAISFIFLFFSIFWLLVLKLSEKEFTKIPKIKRFPNVTFIIPTRNGADRIVRTVNALLKLDYPKDKFDIIIAPNNCTDNTVEVAKALENDQVRVIEVRVPKGKMGKAYAFNQILKIAKGEIVASLDDDSIVSPNALRLMVPLFEDENTAAVVPSYKVYKPKNFIERLQYIEYLVASVSRKLLERVESLFILHGVCCLYDKDILINAGGFDEKSITEDMEIALRLNKLGYDVKFQLNCVNYTEVPNTLPKLHRQRIRWTRGYYHSLFKHKDMLFDQKQGFLGMFMLPIVIFVAAPIAMFTTAYFVYSGLKTLFVKLLAFYSAPQYSVAKALELPTYMSVNSLYILLVVLVIIALYLVYKALFYMSENWKYTVAVLLFVTFYQSFLAAYWTMAALYELVNARKNW